MVVSPRPLVLLLALIACSPPAAAGAATTAGRTAPARRRPGRATTRRRRQSLGFPGFATKNTTRVGGADAIADAAGVAQAVYPSRSRDTRPAAVTLVDAKDWRAAISAAQLMSRPLRAPVLLSDGEDMPEATQSALDELGPTGATRPAARRSSASARPPSAEGVKTTDLEGADAAELAQAIDRLHTAAAGQPSRAVVVAPSSAPEYAMPAAAWAAKEGDPVLWADKDKLPAATKAAITAHQRPRIYVLGPASAISDAVLKQLGKLGTARRITGADPAASSVAFARFDDGRFGWNAVDPGHGLVFASTKRPADAAAARRAVGRGHLRAAARAAPRPNSLAAPVQDYLLDIQPGYDDDPVRGVYNHGWLMGDEKAISVDVQSRIDALLEIQPVSPDA